MNDWLLTLTRRLADEAAIVRVTVTAVRGSAPRDTGSSMLVGAHGESGTIGGGHLEWKAIAVARSMLGDGAADDGAAECSAPNCGAPDPAAENSSRRRDRYTLGAALGQCCGGAVEVCLERFDQADLAFLREGLRLRAERGALVLASRWRAGRASARTWVHAADAAAESAENAAIMALLAAGLTDARAALVRNDAQQEDLWLERADPPRLPLWIFGAGHVARALVQVLDDLPFDIHWIDSRDDAFPASPQLMDRVRCTLSPVPEDEVVDAPPGTLFLVMTHSHDVDFNVVQAILERRDFLQLGLIGSEPKAQRFRQRLTLQGVAPDQLARLTCPIGSVGAGGPYAKLPAAIAVTVAAQLLEWIAVHEVPGATPLPALTMVPAG